MLLRRRRPLVSVIVPVYDVAAYLPAALDSLLAQQHRELEVVVVDDGSTDASGRIADDHAGRDARVRVVHTPNRGLGAARNEGLRHVTGEYVAFLDSDDVLPPTAYVVLLRALAGSGSDFVTGSVARWEDDRLVEPRWMRRLHSPTRLGITAAEHPEILGDVFAWNKLYRRSFWESVDLSWPEGVRYEDQPTTTEAFLRGRFDVLPDVVYHWRIRHDGTSITQQRSSLQDLADRFHTKRLALASVQRYGDPHVQEVFLDRVLAGDLHRYFAEIPGCGDEWWELLRSGVGDLWRDRSLTASGLLPPDRLTGWLVEQGRREDAAAVVTHARALGRPLDRVQTHDGPRIDVPVIDPATVAPAALALREHER